MADSDIVLNIRHLNPLGDQQKQVLLSEFEFPNNEIVVIDERIVDSGQELEKIVEGSNRSSFNVLIIPKIRGG